MKKNIAIILISFLAFSSYKPKQETIIIEGFYSSDWESSIFYELRNNNVYEPSWVFFDKDCKLSDSIENIFNKNNSLYDMYLKVKAVKKDNGNFGHFGLYKSELTVLEVYKIDTTYTLKKFLEKQKSNIKDN